ncbi:hypothetical protein STCU_06369 [Strigomonas culicis]|uniref:Arrestin-like N-terminal domain-containing protein n=1 Tax=Strigomonas culicis TaxID=28005 RepID=S9UB94_9TRYP|nr:hypothetical protein STCU_06369 [Strigomonas culicis]|eukprot:EPY26004.1 hypothetical protein STCU_06369 [Strigomonas culicis]
MSDVVSGLHIDVQFEKSKYTPSEFLHGEVRVMVPAKYKKGYPYHRIRLCLYGKESHVVRDDQAEFDALLASYTSSRVYLSRHVTLAGPPRKSEAMEVEAQVKQEFLYKEHRAAPYARVTPEKSIEDGNRCSSDDEDYDSDEAEETVQPPPAAGRLPGVLSADQIAVAVPDAAEAHRHLRRTPRRLMPGHHAYPFAFRLPPWLPPSLYYATSGAAGSIRYWAEAQLVPPPPRQFNRHNGNGGMPTRKLTKQTTFFVLSVLSKHQLLRCYTEANIMLHGSDRLRQKLKDASASATALQHPEHGVSIFPASYQKEAVTTLPPLSARYQLFGCGGFGNMCCFDSGGAIEVEVQVLCSRALLLDDEEGKNKNIAESIFCAADDHAALCGGAEMELKKQFRAEAMGHVVPTVEDALKNELPLPVGSIPLRVTVRNEHARKRIPTVRVELIENISIFKPLQAPMRFQEPLARYEYTTSIPAASDVTFDCALQLPNTFCKQSSGQKIKHPHRHAGGRDAGGEGKNYTHHKYLPPPGVSTVNLTTALNIIISFPGLNTYIEEEDWFYHTLQVAESIDTTDEVLDLPIKYS